MALRYKIFKEFQQFSNHFSIFIIHANYIPFLKYFKPPKKYLLGFLIQRLWGKSLEISSNFSMGPLFLKYDWMGAHNSGL